MSRLLLCLLFASLVCRLPAEDKPLQPDERDLKVIDAALLHLLANPDFTMILAKKPEAKDDVVLDVTGPEKTGFLQAAQISGELGKKQKVDEELLAATLTRNKKSGYDAVPISYAGAKLDPRIIVGDLTKLPEQKFDFGQGFQKVYPKARGYVSLHLPGYSKDGTQALLRGYTGPSPHGACVTALLELRDGKWTVKWSKVSFFV
jgi:hypothetical protein